VRALLTRLHRYVGLATAVFLAMAGLTGALLAWYEPLSAALAPELHRAPGRGTPLPPFALHAKARLAEPDAVIRDIVLDLEEGRGVAYGLAFDTPRGYDTLWLDPVTGAVLGRVDAGAMPPSRTNLMDFVYRLHYELALPGAWGTWIMGVAALLWFLDCFVGAALTLPRGRPVLRRWGAAWGIERRRLNYDLHRAAGLWLFALLAAIALSSVYFNLREEVFDPVFGLVAKTTPEPFETRPESVPGARPAARIGPAEALGIGTARAAALGWQGSPERLRHRDTLGLWQIYHERPRSEWATAGGYALFIDDQTGEVVHVRAPGGTAGDVFIEWIVALHLGTVLGTPYRWLLTLVGVAVAVLSFTGVVIWLRKRRALRRQRARAPSGGALTRA
jgi:uncharacterized iron-regulated membrane protein